VFVSPGELTPLERDCYYINDLIGLRVVDEHDAELGMIREIIDNPAHDILVVQAEEGVIRLIPLVDAFVRCIDLSACLAVVADLPDGM
jgi:16S rRNA processing protein RimM